MANDFYNKSGNPTPDAPGSSSLIRAEFANVEAGFAKLPTMAGNGGKIVQVNSGGTALEANASIDTTELSYLNGVTSNIQTQLNTEASTRAADDISVQNAAAADATSKANAAQAAAIAASTPVAHASNTGNPHSVTKAQVGLGNVDNTSDVNKPISTATQTALNAKAELASPAFTGAPTAPTAAYGDNTTQLATTAHVRAAVSALPASLPSLVGASQKFLQVNAGETAVEWAGSGADVQEFTSTGTYTVPTAAKFVMVELWGAGGGGGSGQRGAAGSLRTGGTGGGGGSYNYKMFKASEIASAVPVVIGAGGAGGAAVTTDNTAGANGVTGGNTSFGTHLIAYAGAQGLAGFGGAQVGGNGGGMASSTNLTITSTGYTQNMGGGAGNTTFNGGSSGYGGGAGGGISSAPSSNIGGGSLYGGSGGGSGSSISAANSTTAAAAGGLIYTEGDFAVAGSIYDSDGQAGTTPRCGGGGGYGSATNTLFTIGRPAFGNGTFAAVGSGFVATSATGTGNWTAVRTPANFVDLFWDGSQWVLYSTSTVYTTTDFVTYTLKVRPSSAVNTSAIIVVGGLYVAVGSGGGILTSTDLLTWTTRTSGTAVTLTSIAHNGTRYIVVGASGVTLTSTNAIDWTVVTVSGTPALQGVACNGTTFVASSNATPFAFRSTDSGANWAAVTTTLTTGASHKMIAYAGGQWMHVAGSVVYTSSDGDVWTLQTDGTTDNYAGIAYSGSRYVLTSSTNSSTACITSTDGAAWTTAAMNSLVATVGDGGAGAVRGGGGGGGAASLNGEDSGAGGNGGNGFARIYAW